MSKLEPLNFEVVYQPHEVRVYVYATMPHAVSATKATGEVVMQVRKSARVFRYPLHYVARAARSDDQDYLAAAVDLTRVRDGDMTVTFNLENLPQRPKAGFTQVFALSKPKPHVMLAALEKSDKEGIARQKVCPVTGEPLGSMGDPIKVLIDGRPLYLCCRGCLSKVRKDPAAYLPKPQVTLAALEESDKEGIARQKVCPVTGEPLGSMGDPIKVLIDGTPLYLCCQGCVAKVKAAPETYLSKVSPPPESR